MGAVFEIEHVRLKKRLVAKTLHPGLRTRDDFLVRMEIEAQTLARIAHPNIVAVHDLGVTADGIPFFATEKPDLYAVGCVLFELITGQRPFKGPTPRDYMMQHLGQPPARLSETAPKGVPKALDELVASALEKDPAKRPQSALRFASQLHQIRQGSHKVELAQANTTEEM